jgi:hypothetical protein
VGEEVHKMGQAGGWTIGDVVGTCFLIFNWPVTEIDYTLRCQDLAVYDASGGDSGGPVFVDQGGSWEIIGLHIGQDTLGGIDTAFFSRMENIEEDLGAVVTVGIPILESINPRGVERVGGGER